MNKPDCVLLVDDDDVCNFLNANVVHLTDSHLNVQTALNGRSAIEFIKRQKKNITLLILLDLDMPDMDGFEFLDEFVTLPDEVKRNCTIVILTSSDYEKDRVRAKKYNVVCGYVTKPLMQEKLVSILETCYGEFSNR